MKIQVKNVVCPCCEMFIKTTAESLGIKVDSVCFGQLTLEEPASDAQLESLKEKLKMTGLELMEEVQNHVVEKIKSLMRELVLQSVDLGKVNLSHLLADKLQYNYSYLSNVFSKVEGMTIRDYCISLRIEAVKRMLVQDGLELKEIAWRLNYSSVAHLSAQFKKVAGITTSAFKRSRFIVIGATTRTAA